MTLSINEVELDLLKVELLKNAKVIRETLERIGIANEEDKIIYPSCYLLYIEGEPHLVHFKQVFHLIRSGSYNNIGPEDIRRRNAVAFCLRKWGMINVRDSDIEGHGVRLFILPHGQKKIWQVKHKISISGIPRHFIGG